MNHRIAKRRLIVEGPFDEIFFRAILRESGFGEAEVDVGCPTKFGATGNGKGNALAVLSDLVPLFSDGLLTHLGVVIDADFPVPSAAGYSITRDQLDGSMEALGYSRVQRHGQVGLVYAKPHWPAVNAWIMPDNASDGYLEHWILAAVSRSESSLVSHAKSVVRSLPEQRFGNHHVTKAEVASWLAWQKVPGQPPYSAIGNYLLNDSSPHYTTLIRWLRQAFQ